MISSVCIIQSLNDPKVQRLRNPPRCIEWHSPYLLFHPPRVSDEELESDPAAGMLYESSEEGQKVARNKGNTWRAVFRRLAVPRWTNLPSQQALA